MKIQSLFDYEKCPVCYKFAREDIASLEANVDPQDRGASEYQRSILSGMLKCDEHKNFIMKKYFKEK